MKRGSFLLSTAIFYSIFLTSAGNVFAVDKSDAQETVDRAELTFASLMADANFAEMRKLAKKAKGIFIAPQVLKGAFIFGASGGTGVFLVRGDNGKWSYPAFYTVGSVSFGLQIGGQASEVVLLAMTDKGVTNMLRDNVKLGADVSIAAGPVSTGTQGETLSLNADILSFTRSKGIFGGVSLDGAIVGVRENLNEAYYGKAVTPEDILINRKASNTDADDLRASVLGRIDRPN